MTDRIGTCSLCGGAVETSGDMLSTHCVDCGAVPQMQRDVIIPMRKPANRLPRPKHLTYVEDIEL